jgi:hypothetical protein
LFRGSATFYSNQFGFSDNYEFAEHFFYRLLISCSHLGPMLRHSQLF